MASAEALAAEVGERLGAAGLTLGVAESLTGGMLTSRLAAAPDAGTWLRGGIVAYAAGVKHELLGVRPGPVVSEEAARDLCDAATRLLGADVGLAVTGVGGPGPQDGRPPGTVWMAACVAGRTVPQAEERRFDGSPSDICEATVTAALELVIALLDAG